MRAEERDLEVEGDGDGEGEMEPGGNGVFRAEGRASAWKRTWAGKGWDGEASAEGREREGEEEGYEGGEGGEGVKRAQSPLMWSSDVARKMWGAEMSVIEGLEEAVEDGARSGMEGREGKEEEDGLIGGSVKDKLNDLDELRPEAEKVVGLAFFSEDQELAWVADRGKARGGRR